MINQTSGIYTKEFLSNSRYQIGDYTYGVPQVHDWGDGGNLIIGKFTSIAQNVTILLGGYHRHDWISTYPFKSIKEGLWPRAKHVIKDRTSKGDVIIGNDVWIGINSTILSGVTIGDGAVIAACSVVTKNIPPYAIVGGNPAKIIKMRFTDHEIEKLLAVSWWNWSEERINESIGILCSDNLYRLIPPQTKKEKIKHALPGPVVEIIKKLKSRMRRK